MRNLFLIASVLATAFGASHDLSGKEYSWGSVTVLHSDETYLEFELVVAWPESSVADSDLFQASTLDLPGSQLTPESQSLVPLTIGSSLSMPPAVSASLELISIETEAFPGVTGSEIDRALRASRYSEFTSLGHPEGFDFLKIDSENINETDASGLPAFVSISSIGWLREHRLLTLQCHPVRVDRAQERLERLKRVTGRLHFSEPLTGDVVENRAQRLRSKVFDEIVSKQVVNPELRLATSSSNGGLRRTAHTSLDDGGMHLKVSFLETGMYQLRGASLAAQGVELNEIDTSSFQLFDMTGELALFVDDGGDGRLDGSDRIVFYGEALRSNYAVTNSFVLRWGKGNGARMAVIPAAVSDSPSFPSESIETAHFEEDLHYWQNMVDGEGEDHWFWESQLSGPDRRDYTVNVSDISVASAESVRLTVAFKGLSSIPEVVPDHHTRVYLNGNLVSDSRWDGNARFVQEATFEVSQLLEGENVVGIEVVGDLPVELDQVFVDWIEIDYPRRLVARDGRLAFDGAFGDNLVTGLSNDSIEVFDVTDIRNVSRLSEGTVQLAAQGFTTGFNSSRFPLGRFVVLDSFGFLSPTALELVSSSHWKRPDHQADYLMVCHRSFVPSLEPLVQRKREQGFSVAVIPVDELYDEFAGGVPTADAIKSFVHFAYHEWEDPAPAYLLLVGDSTIDPRDIFESGTLNLLPSEITEMNFFGESVSDDGFVRVDGDDVLPDLLVGRLPAESEEGLGVMIQKTLDYELLVTAEDWNHQVLVVADDDSEVYEELSENLAESLPVGFEADRVFLSSYPPGDPTSDIIRGLNEGQLMVNYTGHGSRSTWGIGDISGVMLENADAAVLSNSEALSVVTVANCLNGFFVARSTKPCLAEVFLRNSGGGAVAAWAPTSLGFPSGHRLLVGNFYHTIFQEEQIELGAAVVGAKVSTLTNAGFFADQVKSYTFFGDPSLRLAVPDRISPSVVSIALNEEGALELIFDVRAGRDYVVESSVGLGAEAVWRVLPESPHNSGRVPIDADVREQYFRVISSLSVAAPVMLDR